MVTSTSPARPAVGRAGWSPGGRETVAAERYRMAAELLAGQVASADPGAPVRLAKRTSNLFRPRSVAGGRQLDVTAFTGVVDVDPAAGTAQVLGMTTYEQLVDRTLPHGLLPLVVPELKTITVGGAVTGLGIESSSFRNGMPHESVLEMDLLTGDGRLLTARPEGPHADLFFGFPNSYGTLGYALRLSIELEPVQKFVALEHIPLRSPASAFEALQRICADRCWGGEPVDFVDGVAFSPGELYLTLGRYADEEATTSDYTGQRIYYRSLRDRSHDRLNARDYVWRWDTDWFWCSRAFGAQHPLLRRAWPRRWRRSDVYWRIVAAERRFGVIRRLDSWRGRPDREAVIQDVQIPVDRAAEFLHRFHREIGMSPVWLCPLRQRRADRRWTLYPLDPTGVYVNFGFWGTVARPPGAAPDHHNRLVEELVDQLGGRKSLYSTSCYREPEFWPRYGGADYQDLKARYDPDRRLLDLYQKCVERR